MFKTTKTPVQFPIGSQVRPVGQAHGPAWTVTAISGDARRIEHHFNEDTFMIVWFGVSELRDAR